MLASLRFEQGPQKMSGMPLRGDRIHRYVNAFCPLCHEEGPDRPLAEVQRLSGWLVEREGRIWLERGCATHGLVRTLYDESPDILRYLEQWTAPTKRHEPDVRGNFKPVPAAYADGLPEMQTQHTCILLEDLLDHCNLKCPTCFAESSPARASVAPLEQVLASIDTRLSREGQRIDVLMLSGGEPTLYPWLGELLDEVTARPIVRVLINTNGLRIAQDDELLALLTRHRERVEVYLQYDGESAEASTYHRGADIRRFKERAIERLSANGIFTTLTMTAALGVNDDEIGKVVKRALGTPYVGGVTIQPVFGSGRARRDRPPRPAHPHRRARPAGGADGRRGHLARPDGAAVLHPHCCSVGYLLRDDSGTWQSLTSLIGHDRLKQLAGPRTRPAGQPDRRRRDPGGDEGGRQGLAPRPALGAVEPQPPVDGHDLARHLPELRPRDRHADLSCFGRASRASPIIGQAPAGDAGRAGAPADGQALHGHEHDDRGAAHAVLRARRATVNGETGEHQCAPFCAVQAWAPLSASRISRAKGLPLVETSG